MIGQIANLLNDIVGNRDDLIRRFEFPLTKSLKFFANMSVRQFLKLVVSISLINFRKTFLIN